MDITCCNSPGTNRLFRRARVALAVATLLPLLAGASVAMAEPSASEPVAAPVAAAATPAVERDPKAIEALDVMGAHLRTLLTFSVRSETTKDEVLASGQKIQFAGTVEMQVRAPDRLRADVSSDRKQRQFYYDGKTVTVYAPRMKYYATAEAPPTLREMLAALNADYGIDMPLVDLFLWGTDQADSRDIKSAIHVGMARIDGVDCDHYAYRQEGVDWQVWIERGNSPLPRKLLITTLVDPSQPQYTAELKWNLSNRYADKAFVFVPPKDAEKIMLLPLSAAK
jgi:hypothetical protein